jgi:glycosyltransferase involved in cell wall biosynthesis
VEIRYTRDRAELARTLRAMDLLVFPSLWDGLPNALLEGMALARPVLASAVGAIPEVLEHGVNGFLVPPSRLDTFGDEALRVADLPVDERARIGRAARESVASRFRPEAERDALLAVLGSR